MTVTRFLSMNIKKSATGYPDRQPGLHPAGPRSQRTLKRSPCFEGSSMCSMRLALHTAPKYCLSTEVSYLTAYSTDSEYAKSRSGTANQGSGLISAGGSGSVVICTYNERHYIVSSRLPHGRNHSDLYKVQHEVYEKLRLRALAAREACPLCRIPSARRSHSAISGMTTRWSSGSPCPRCWFTERFRSSSGR